ncbi:MAG: hypothetical protein ACYDAE_13905 [Steroidobacteraceae bacterium]
MIRGLATGATLNWTARFETLVAAGIGGYTRRPFEPKPSGPI